MRNDWKLLKKRWLEYQLDAIAGGIAFIRKNLIEIELFLISAVILSFYKYVPYVNILIDPFVYQAAIVLAAVVVFGVGVRAVLAGILLLLILSVFPAISGNSDTVGIISNIAYFLLCYACIRLIMELRKTA